MRRIYCLPERHADGRPRKAYRDGTGHDGESHERKWDCGFRGCVRQRCVLSVAQPTIYVAWVDKSEIGDVDVCAVRANNLRRFRNPGGYNGFRFSMNWRRGLLFAVVNVVIATPLVFWQEAERSHLRGTGTSFFFLSAESAEGQVEILWISPQENIVGIVNVPATILAGWQLQPRTRLYSPPPRYTLAGVAHSVYGTATITAQVVTALGFISLIFVQWLLIGARPLVRPKHWCFEPAALITICAAVSVCLLALLHGGIYRLPLLAAYAAWLFLICTALLRAAKLVWKSIGFRKQTG